MISFFRRIRKSFPVSGQGRKYFFYAIGEIALVVIGILIAVQINTWNEHRKDRNEENLILQGLEGEFQENQRRIETSIQANENTISAANQLVGMIRSGEILKASPKSDSLITRLTLFSSFDASTGVVEEIINSGKLPIITNRALRTQLTNWSSIIEEVQEDRRIRVINFTSLLIPTLIKYFPLSNSENYLDFSTWSENYSVNKIGKSPFLPKLKKVDLMELENVIWQFKYDNDFVIMTELELEAFIHEALGLIQSNRN